MTFGQTSRLRLEIRLIRSS